MSLLQKLNLEPERILAGRRINENMGIFVALQIHQKLQAMNIDPSTARVLILGLTFKEDIPDLRNTKVVDVIAELKRLGYSLDVHDPFAASKEAKDHLQLNLLKEKLSKFEDFELNKNAYENYCNEKIKHYKKQIAASDSSEHKFELIALLLLVHDGMY